MMICFFNSYLFFTPLKKILFSSPSSNSAIVFGGHISTSMTLFILQYKAVSLTVIKPNVLITSNDKDGPFGSLDKVSL